MYKNKTTAIHNTHMMKFNPSVFGQDATALNALYEWQAGNPDIKTEYQIIIEEEGTVEEACSVASMACARAFIISELIEGVACPKAGAPGIECAPGIPENSSGKKLLEALKTSKHAARWLDRWMGCPALLYILVQRTLRFIECDIRDMIVEARE